MTNDRENPYANTGPVSDGADTYQSGSPMTGGVSDASSTFLERARLQVLMRRRAAANAHAAANKTQSQSEPNSCVEEPTGQASPPASQEDKDTARDALDQWRAAAARTVVDTAQWFAANHGEFIRRTGSNNRLTWTDGKFYWALTKVGGLGIKKLLSAGGVGGGAIGVVAGLIVGQLTEKIVSVITSEINGNPGSKQTEAVEEAVGKSNDSASRFFTQVADGQAEINGTFDRLKGQLSDFDSVQRVLDWTQQELADLTAPPKGDMSLFDAMYADWALEHTGGIGLMGGVEAGEGVDEQQWELAVARAHGGDLRRRGDVFAYQTRLQLTEAGLPTEDTDAMLATMAKTPPNADNPYDGKTLSFRIPKSSGTLLEFLMKHDAAISENLPDIESGDFLVRCTLDIASGGIATGWHWKVTVPYRSSDPLDAGLPQASGERVSTFKTTP